LILAFVGSAALWWIYFDRGAEAGVEVISAAEDPGRFGVTAYTYFHIPMVAGIIVAATGYELAIAHPGADADVTTASLILGGPALYLVGHVLFKWVVWERVAWSRIARIAGLAALVPLARVSSALVLLAAATAVVVVVASQDTRIAHRADRLEDDRPPLDAESSLQTDESRSVRLPL
jgi:low temperature requirement protein LtrA